MKRLLVPLLSTVLVLGAIEGTARLAGVAPLSDPRDSLTGMFVPDPDMFWALRPGYVGAAPAETWRWGNEPLVINLHGMRGPPVTVKKPEGVQRAVVLGGSHPMGMWVTYDQMYSSVVERRLNQRGGSWQVLNAAVAGYTSYQGVVQLREQLLRFEPDLVISDLGHNDGLPRLAWGVSRPDRAVVEPSGAVAALRRVLRRSAAYRAALARVSTREGRPEVRVSDEEHRQNTEAIGELAASIGAKTLYLSQFKANVESPGVLNSDHRGCTFAEQELDAVVDVCGLFIERDDLQHLFVDPLHANAVGHGMIAEAVVDKLVELGWVE